MKKIISLILVISTLLYMTSFLISAEDLNVEKQTTEENDSSSNSTLSQLKDILSFSCYYDIATEKINVTGTMNHDSFALYGNATLVIYEIPIGKTENDVIKNKSSKPIAEAPVSITFAFSFKASSIASRYAKYAIFVKTELGEYILTTESQYAEIATENKISDTKNDFKGYLGEYSSDISNLRSEIAFIPVYIDSIYTHSSNGYVYQVEDHIFFFDKQYIDELDAQIKSLSCFDTNVYLQILMRPNDIVKAYANDNAKYTIPDVYDKETVILIHAIIDFLISRYNTDEGDNSVTGIVIGKRCDDPIVYNSYKNVTLSEYVTFFGQYVATVATAAKSVNKNIDVMLSFSGNGFFKNTDNPEAIHNGISAKAFFELLMEYFDASSYSGIKCSLLIETDDTPLSINSSNIQDGITLNTSKPTDYFSIDNSYVISEFLKEASAKYDSASKYYNVLWTPNDKLAGTALCAAYSYAYYSLLCEPSVTNFTVEFSSVAQNRESFSDLAFIYKNIDTDKAYDATKSILALFNKNSWAEVLNLTEIPIQSKKTLYESKSINRLPKNIKGEFEYFDFSKAFLADNWHKGVGCTDVKIDYSFSGDKALRSDFSLGNQDFCDLIYIYEYPESIVYTPYIALDLEVLSEDSSSLYEINFNFNSDLATFTSKTIVQANDACKIVLDLSDATEFSLLKNVKISLRSLDDNSNGATLWIYGIDGYSEKYSSSELRTLIENERSKIKLDEKSSTQVNWKMNITIIIILATTSLLGFALILIIQKNNRGSRKE